MSRNAWLRIAKSRIALFACWSVVAVVRTPNGNDYGKDLLRKHYEQSHKPART